MFLPHWIFGLAIRKMRAFMGITVCFCITISKCKATAWVLKGCTWDSIHNRFNIILVQPVKKPRLLQYVCCSPNQKSAPITTPPQEVLQFFKYLSVGSVQRFWYFERKRLLRLAQSVQKVICVVASSSPVEIESCVGWYLMRPHRASLGPNTLRNMVRLGVRGTKRGLDFLTGKIHRAEKVIKTKMT